MIHTDMNRDENNMMYHGSWIAVTCQNGYQLRNTGGSKINVSCFAGKWYDGDTIIAVEDHKCHIPGRKFI